MDRSLSAHRAALTAQAVDTLNRYTPFCTHHQVTFTQTDDGRIAGHLVRTDGVPFAQSKDPLDSKLAHLQEQTARIRPFFLPMCKTPWQEQEANEVSLVDFDYAAILGYGMNDQGEAFLKALYFLPTDALLAGQAPKDGVWRLPLATYYVHQLSLDPRKKFARVLYLVDRMTEALEYQYDKAGRYFSVQPLG